MNEREIFDAALAIADDAERFAYLDSACGGDTKMREHIEGLLEAHGKLGSFLESDVAGEDRLDRDDEAAVVPAQEKPEVAVHDVIAERIVLADAPDLEQVRIRFPKVLFGHVRDVAGLGTRVLEQSLR